MIVKVKSHSWSPEKRHVGSFEDVKVFKIFLPIKWLLKLKIQEYQLKFLVYITWKLINFPFVFCIIYRVQGLHEMGQYHCIMEYWWFCLITCIVQPHCLIGRIESVCVLLFVGGGGGGGGGLMKLFIFLIKNLQYFH